MKKTILMAPIVTLLALLALITLAGAQQSMSAELSISSGEWTVGDPLPLILTVQHPDGTHVIMPELGEQWGEFVVSGQSLPETVANSDGSKITTVQIDARLFAPGDFQTPPLAVSVADESGSLTEVVATPLPVSITSVLVEGDETLRDIKPQAELPVSNLWLFALLVSLLAAAFALAIYANHRRNLRLARLALDRRLPHEVALDELQRIAVLQLAKAGAFKQHYGLVADTVRNYLQDAFHVLTLERTTAEIRAGLRQADIAPETGRRFVDILADCDLVKFADVKPAVAEAEAIVEQARAAVEISRPISLGLAETGEHGRNSLNGQFSTAEVSA